MSSCSSSCHSYGLFFHTLTKNKISCLYLTIYLQKARVKSDFYPLFHKKELTLLLFYIYTYNITYPKKNMSIKALLKKDCPLEELEEAVSPCIDNIEKIPNKKLQKDFYLVDPQKLINILSNDARTKPLARLLQDLQGQIGYIIGYTKKDIDNCISTTKD